MKRILLAGGTGQVGSVLRKHMAKECLEKAHEVAKFTILTRSTKGRVETPEVSFMSWEALEKEGLNDEYHSVINLAGANIIESAWKKTGPVYTSRIDTTRTLVEAMKKNPPKNYIAASAVGIYETGTTEELDETSSLLPYDKMDFAQQLVYDWEQESLKAKEIADLTTTIVRISFVLGAKQNGTAGLQIFPPYVGVGVMGDGAQPFPWIHEDDLAEMIFQAAMNPKSTGGIINAVTPDVLTQEQFSAVFNRESKTKLAIPVPAALLKIILRQKASLLLEGPRVVPKELKKVLPSFEYTFPTIHSAMANLQQEFPW